MIGVALCIPSSPLSRRHTDARARSYVSSLIPGLRMLYPNSPPAGFALARALFKADADSFMNPVLPVTPLTAPERIETLGIVSATVVLIGVLLLGVVALQAGEWFAVRLNAQSRRMYEEAERKRLAEAKAQ